MLIVIIAQAQQVAKRFKGSRCFDAGDNEWRVMIERSDGKVVSIGTDYIR